MNKVIVILAITSSLSLFIFCSRENPKPMAMEMTGEDGCPNVIYPDWQTSDYVLPYPVGQTFRIDLSQCTFSYHAEGQPDQFGIDFGMAIGTLITASRAGVVVHVEESGTDGNHPNNLVVVRHADLTYAQYMHLTHNGALVEVGDEVIQGTRIGRSGATGLAGYPHLHFIVTKNGWQYPYEGLPYNFKNTSPNPRSLVSGSRYEAMPY